MIHLACPSCGHKLILQDEYAGKQEVCPQCKQRLIVPASNLLGAETVSLAPPLADLDGEALDFLAPPQGPGELGRLGTYRILKLLGAGGMGMVLHAEDLVLKRAVALKVIRPELVKSTDARQRFLREARAIAAIEHRHIVHIYQVAEDRGVPYLAMPFLKGESLEARLKRERKLSVADSVCIGRQIAEGLAAAHKNELIHRDIKPGNIWLEAQDDPRQPRDGVKILDFGLARAAAGDDVHLTKTGAILGTPAYMAPEQARAEKVDARCDLFSLGAVLYRMLTGTLPFKGKDTMSQLMSLTADTPRPLREANPDVPPSLADLVMRLLAKEPDGRPPSAHAVADALAAIEDSSVRPLDPAAAPPTARGGAQRPRWLVPLAASGGLLGLLAVVLIFAWGSAEKPAGSGQSSKTPTPSSPRMGEKEIINRDKELIVQERPKSITNSIGMKLVFVAPGVFLMGSPENEAERLPNEALHEVEITRPFYVGVYEVTQEQYERVMGEKPSYFSSTGDGKDKVQGMDTRQFPVENVSWEDAVKFCRLLSELPEEKAKERLYCLPTEAEWEYACRGGPSFKKPSPPFYFGNSLSSTQANFNGNSPYGDVAKHDPLHRTTKVGSYPPNPLGVYDLHGNVWEWCADWYAADYFGRKDPQGPKNGERRVLRGGSWTGLGRSNRAAYRYGNALGGRYVNVGFRVVLDATTIPKLDEKNRPFAERPKAITNSIGMKLVFVAPGVFLMGSPENEAKRNKDNEDQHKVEITRPFYVGVYEVTQEQYERVMGLNPSWFKSTGDGKNTRQFPVERVSWEDAVKFCGRLSERPEETAKGRLYRLPTEAEWEYACRGGPFVKKPSPPFSFGDSLSSTQANFNGNFPYGGAAKGAYLERTTKVGSYPPNPLGVYDLHGNVWEWCADWYAAEYSGRKDPQGPENGERRVLRGGSWNYFGRDCRAAYRNGCAPGARNDNLGFRVVLVAGART